MCGRNDGAHAAQRAAAVEELLPPRRPGRGAVRVGADPAVLGGNSGVLNERHPGALGCNRALAERRGLAGDAEVEAAAERARAGGGRRIERVSEVETASRA